MEYQHHSSCLFCLKATSFVSRQTTWQHSCILQCLIIMSTSQCSNINRYLVWCISSYLEAHVVWLFSLKERMRKQIITHKVSILVLFILLCYFIVSDHSSPRLNGMSFMRSLFCGRIVLWTPQDCCFLFLSLNICCFYTSTQNTKYLKCFMRNAWDISLTLW